MKDKIKKILQNYMLTDMPLNDATQQVLDLFAVSGWLELKGNESVFNEYAKTNCWCKFDDGTECRYEDEHPMAVMTHFRCK